MLIKAITGFNQGVESIDTHILIDNVSQLQVCDTWTSGRSEEDVCGGVEPNGIQDDILEITRPKFKDKSYSQQRIVIGFMCGGRHRTLVSEMPVFVMNDAGKTVQTYNPISKAH